MPDKHSDKERIKEITAGIEKGIQELFESDRYRNYLTTMSRFHRYSLNNVMLIHAQKPDATLVAGFNKWKNSFGRHVKKDWQNIHETIPARDVHRRFLEAPGDTYAVMQLKGSAPADLRYTGLNYLSQPPSPGNYDILYTGPIVCAQNQLATLENLFEIFNINRPGNFTGHSLSVSDIIALKQDGVVSYHYCDNVGFQELPGFMSENYLKAAEMSTEDDYGMIDGIINNGKQPTVAEPEQQARSGQPISLMDLADAVHREKKPSVLEKLKDQPQQSQRKAKPRKSKEQEI